MLLRFYCHTQYFEMDKKKNTNPRKKKKKRIKKFELTLNE